ncbi:MAG: S1C family serine protease [Treponemataceae bacterium]|nr:S1C family serine protease [Treponemataceae bacterium]
MHFFNRHFALLLLLFPLFFSCATNSNSADSSVQNSDGTDDAQLVKSMISEIEHSCKNDGVKQFYRSYILLSENPDNQDVRDLFNRSFESAKESLKSLVENEETIEFYTQFNTINKICDLSSAFYKEASSFSLSDFQQDFDKAKNLIFSTEEKKLIPSSTKPLEKISSVIDGTVTIWMDLGVKMMQGRAYANRAIGSGFFIDQRGYIITNYHVISSEVDPKYEGISKLYIKLNEDNETRISAKVVGFDKSLDIALLKTEASPDYTFPLGSSTALDVGDEIFAIGSPIGLERTLTRGIVSAEGRQLFSIGKVMQIDAALNQGNSGGPIIDRAGNVQGIAFAGMVDYEGLNFAIPVEYLTANLPYLFCGQVKHSYIGAFGRTGKNDEGKSTGVEVLWLETNSNAKKAGLEEGDLIQKVNSNPVTSLDDLHKRFVEIRPHSIIDLEVKKSDGKTKVYHVYADERTENPMLQIFRNETLENAFYPLYGLKLKRSSSVYKSKFTVESVLKGSVADESGFSENDPIQIFKTAVQEDKYILSEVYSKKKSNGYLDAAMVLATLLDSEKLF